MNLSPCFDRQTPVIWRHKKEPMVYVQVSIEDKEMQVHLQDT